MEFEFDNFNPQKNSPQILSNSENFNKTFKKYSGVKKPVIEYAADNPESFPANIHDICNYLARFGMANYQIQPVMRLDGRLDYEKLSQAVRLTIDAEPVFGCRFVESNIPYWKRIDNIDEIQLCALEKVENADEAIKSFLESPLDIDRDPMVKLKLIRSGSYDTICLKINHICCDGAGTKEYIQLLSEFYNALEQKNNVLSITPRIAGRKDQDKLVEALGIKDPKSEWKPLQDAPRTVWPFPWKPVLKNDSRYAMCRMPQSQLDVMSRYGKARGATINDLILTAYYRAMFNFSHPLYGIPMDISTTVDLRRYLPDNKTEAIRNFSGGFITRIERIKHEPFAETLSRVVKATSKAKKQNPGLQNAIGGEIVQNMDFLSLFNYFKIQAKTTELIRHFPFFPCNAGSSGLSNLGIISKSLIKFGNNTVTDAYIVPPAISSPGFLLLAGTYNGVLTFSTSYYKGSILRKDIEKLLDMVKTELMEGCV